MTKFKIGDIVHHRDILGLWGQIEQVSRDRSVISVSWKSCNKKVTDSHCNEELILVQSADKQERDYIWKPFNKSNPKPIGQPNTTPQWFVVPSYNVSTEPHKIINRAGELVARFEDLDEAIRVVDLWNREVGK